MQFSNNLDVTEICKQFKRFLNREDNIMDDIKVFWNKQYLVIFYYIDDVKVKISVYDIQDDPKFLYSVEKPIIYQSPQAFIFDKYVVMVPKFPSDFDVLVLMLDREKTN